MISCSWPNIVGSLLRRLLPTIICGLMLCHSVGALAAGYRVGTGDTLAVTVRGHDDFGGTVTVAADGSIRLPVVEQVPAAGLTLDELTTTLVTGYKRRLIKPDVFITVTTTRAATCYLLGAVKNPSIYPLHTPQGDSALELIMQAGGLAQPPSSCRATVLRKASGERQALALDAVMAGLPTANSIIHEGDTLLIEALPTIAVYVTGEVQTAGLYELPEGATLLQALARAGGIRGEMRERGITLVRGKETITRDAEVLYRPDSQGDVALQKADVVRVESTLITVSLTGEVKTPTSYTVQRGAGLTDVLNLAGGPTAAARLTAVTITHGDGRQETVDASRGATFPLQTGDRIIVPTSLVTVTLAGEVKMPGAYQVPPQTSLADVVALAGGSTQTASLGAVRIVHLNGTLETVALGTGATASVRDGDRIIIPTAADRIAVLGNVRNPNYYPIDGQRPYTVSEAIIRAGGLAENSAASKSTIIRTVNGTSQQIPINLDTILHKPDPKTDVVLLPGDVILVPKSNALKFKDVLTSITSFSLLRGLFGL